MNGRKIVPVPQNLSSFILLFQVWKNNSMFVCVSGVGAKEMLFTGLSITPQIGCRQEQWPVVTVSPSCSQKNSSSLDVWL